MCLRQEAWHVYVCRRAFLRKQLQQFTQKATTEMANDKIDASRRRYLPEQSTPVQPRVQLHEQVSKSATPQFRQFTAHTVWRNKD